MLNTEQQCYLCGSLKYKYRPGSVRDNPTLKICECTNCGLVYLSSFDHADHTFYENSGMHGDQLPDMDYWLKSTESDDNRRFSHFKSLLNMKTVLDFGCGAGGFLMKAQAISKVYGVEPEKRVQPYLKNRGISVYDSIDDINHQKFDIITLFHVLEHLHDPKETLKKIGALLSVNGEIIIEVPNADDALLTLYKSEAFANFTYWSCHLFLFTIQTLKLLATQSGLRINYIEQVQRYSLANHLFWLSQGKPGGHQHWHYFDDVKLTQAYEHTLASIGKCDTLLMSLSIK